MGVLVLGNANLASFLCGCVSYLVEEEALSSYLAAHYASLSNENLKCNLEHDILYFLVWFC